MNGNGPAKRQAPAARLIPKSAIHDPESAIRSPSPAPDHVRLRLRHPPGVERLIQRRLVRQLTLQRNLPDRLARFEALLRDVGGLVVADEGGEARAHRQALLDERLAPL